MAFSILYRRELSSFFVSPVAYVVLFASALSIGGYFAIVLTYMNDYHESRITVLTGMVMSFPFWLILLAQVPLITMRSLAEEYKLGTIEMLLTAPVRMWEVVLAKYLGALTFFLILWSPLAFDLVLLYLFSGEHVPIVWPTTGLTFLMMLLIGMTYIAIGIMMSAMTRNQIVASILCFVTIFTLFAVSFIPPLAADHATRTFFEQFSAYEQMMTFSKGIFDTRPVVLYASATAFVLFLTERMLETRRLSS